MPMWASPAASAARTKARISSKASAAGTTDTPSRAMPRTLQRAQCHAMEMRILGSTGVQVSPLCLGAMMFGAWGNPDRAEGIRIIHRALDAGLNFVDTADVYSAGESEEIVGEAL